MITEFQPAFRPIIHHSQNDGAIAMRALWCVYEHAMSREPGAPPETIFIGYTPLRSLFDMVEGRSNTAWMEITNAGAMPVMVTLVAICNEMTEASVTAMRHMKSRPEWPYCNKHGYNVAGMSRRITCSDGREFANQTEAATALGVTSGAISQHMTGKLKSVKGFRLEYSAKVVAR